MRTPHWLVGALLTVGLTACPKKSDPAPVVSWADTPVLPSPSAGSYARTLGTPPDPPLAAYLHGVRWDASLAGAAAGVALVQGVAPSRRAT